MLTARLRHQESGFTLVELLVASSLMIVVLSATLTTFNGFLNGNRRTTNQNDQQDRARRSIDQAVRQLRNLANPTNTTATIAYADDNALIFQTTDPNKQWVDYCLQTQDRTINAKTITASADNAILWYQVYTGAAVSSPPSMSAGSTCPDPGAAPAHWTQATRLVANVTSATGARPIFQYLTFGSATPMSTSPAITDPKVTATIARAVVQLFIDVEPTRPPAETVLSSGAYLRNQNQVPVASFKVLHASGNTYTLDGGSSSDPEQRTLRYDWYEGQVGAAAFAAPPADPGLLSDCTQASPPVSPSPWGLSCIGTGPTLVHDFGSSTTAFTPSGSTIRRANVWLRVTDPGNLADVTEPSSGTTCPLTTDVARLATQCDGVPVGA
ncbi:MAG: prepilin-type N-terminal cleavage/methylation domain-containing protein [Thermoleophilaceae bacterium]